MVHAAAGKMKVSDEIYILASNYLEPTDGLKCGIERERVLGLENGNSLFVADRTHSEKSWANL